jgi:hypothetical protein
MSVTPATVGPLRGVAGLGEAREGVSTLTDTAIGAEGGEKGEEREGMS